MTSIFEPVSAKPAGFNQPVPLPPQPAFKAAMIDKKDDGPRQLVEPDRDKPVPSGSVWFYDLEAVPDESRYPRPDSKTLASATEEELREEIVKFRTAKDMADWIKGAGFCAETLNLLVAIETGDGGKSRKGVLDAISSARKSNDAEVDNWKALAKDPFKSCIVAAGWASGDGDIFSLSSRSEAEETALLEMIWQKLSEHRRRCGYFILGYDDLMLIVRSLLLGVTPSIKLNRSRFSNSQAIDLMYAICPSGQGAPKCKDVARDLGITVPAGKTSGADVLDFVDADRWDKLEAYVESDVYVEREIYWRLVDFIDL